ncbi:MAG: metallophosphoesterase family protein [Actinomycetota bacterium]
MTAPGARPGRRRCRALAAVVLAAAVLAGACSPGGGDARDERDTQEGAGDRTPAGGGDPLPAGGVRFVVVGDFGTGKAPQQEVADAMCEHHAREPFDFIVSTGDNVYPDGEPEDFHDNFIEPYECLTDRGVRWHATLGNHDASTDGGQPQIDDPAFGMPASYYTWRLRPISFVMLDSNELDNPEVEQIAWMEERLATARTARWTVVVFHDPVYSAGQHGSTPRFDTLLADRFEQLGVDLVLNGHDHLYARAHKDGIDYVVTGGGGAPIDECLSSVPPEVSKCIPELHYTEVEAGPKELTVTAIAPDDRILDRFEIRPSS